MPYLHSQPPSELTINELIALQSPRNDTPNSEAAPQAASAPKLVRWVSIEEVADAETERTA